ncbi:MAG: DUF1127 domain-containing protein [Pseudomonadota bacterium]
MAHALKTQTLPFGAITVHQIVDAVRGVNARVDAYISAQRTAAALRKLSPEQLEDIGLAPMDIEEIAAKGLR